VLEIDSNKVLEVDFLVFGEIDRTNRVEEEEEEEEAEEDGKVFMEFPFLFPFPFWFGFLVFVIIGGWQSWDGLLGGMESV